MHRVQAGNESRLGSDSHDVRIGLGVFETEDIDFPIIHRQNSASNYPAGHFEIPVSREAF